MHISKQFIKPFPEYEDIFYDDLEQHKKHFLPICSINLQCIEPELDEWVHIVSAKKSMMVAWVISPNHFTQILRKQIH